MTLGSSIIEDRIPEYELAGDDVLRALDPTEHNLERLNARARGSARVYLVLKVEGPLSHAAFEHAVDALTGRHPLLRVRVVRGGDGALFFAPTRGDRADGTARVPVSYRQLDDLAAWPELIEADMNAGAIASGRGPLFAFALIEPRGLADGASGERIVVLLGHHAASDATSGIALLDGLLQELAEPGSRPPLPDRTLKDPFSLKATIPELAELELELRNAREERSPEERQRRLALVHTRLERCEAILLGEREAGARLPAALKSVQGWLSAAASELWPAAGVLPEVDLGTGGARYERTATLFVSRDLTREDTHALRRVTKQHGLTLHAALSAAVLMAQAARHAELAQSETASAPLPERFALACAVNLRKQLAEPLEPHDLRMAIDVLVSRIAVQTGERFWELARRVGEDVTSAVGAGRALSSWFRTERRDFAVSPPGVALPLISNVGQVALATEYGPLRVHELRGAMTTHGSFQLAALFLTFDDRLFSNFYAETPTVSRASFERFTTRVLHTLGEVSRGADPTFEAAG